MTASAVPASLPAVLPNPFLDSNNNGNSIGLMPPTHLLARPMFRPNSGVAGAGSASTATAASQLSGNSASLQSNSANSNVGSNSGGISGASGSALSANVNPNTPYWWRPHLAKLPGLKQQQQQRDQQPMLPSNQPHGLLRPAYAGQGTGDSNVARDSPLLITGLHGSHLDLQSSIGQGLPTIRAQDAFPAVVNTNGSTKSLPPKTGAWLLVVGGLVAVVVAFLIVCSLFACTNYLFFPPKRKSTASTSGSSGTATLPLSGLRSQLIGTPTAQTPYMTHQYQMQTHLQYTQPHYEYPLQHTIIK